MTTLTLGRLATEKARAKIQAVAAVAPKKSAAEVHPSVALKDQRNRLRGTLNFMAKTWPEAFGDSRQPVLLAIGIHEDILTSGNFRGGAEWLHLVLWHWTSRTQYLQAIIAGGPRNNLHGEKQGGVSRHQQKVATRWLEGRLQKGKGNE